MQNLLGPHLWGSQGCSDLWHSSLYLFLFVSLLTMWACVLVTYVPGAEATPGEALAFLGLHVPKVIVNITIPHAHWGPSQLSLSLEVSLPRAIHNASFLWVLQCSPSLASLFKINTARPFLYTICYTLSFILYTVLLNTCS